MVAASLHESQKIVVCNVMTVDGELGNGHFVGGELVVPAKFLFVRIVNAKRGASCRDFNEARLHAWSFPGHFLRRTSLFARG